MEGDFFLLTYSGYGGQINDVNNDEPDALDETWALYDRQLIDDELHEVWSRFRPGVHICVLSDSCHSGTVTKQMFFNPEAFTPQLRTRIEMVKTTARPKFLPSELQAKIYKERARMYDEVRKKTPPRTRVNVECSVILISACQDNQVALDGNKNGLFTETLLRVWNDGHFTGTYHHFRNEIAALLPPTQSPNFTILGHRDRAFERQKPFAIVAPRVAAAA